MHIVILNRTVQVAYPLIEVVRRGDKAGSNNAWRQHETARAAPERRIPEHLQTAGNISQLTCNKSKRVQRGLNKETLAMKRYRTLKGD